MVRKLSDEQVRRDAVAQFFNRENRLVAALARDEVFRLQLAAA